MTRTRTSRLAAILGLAVLCALSTSAPGDEGPLILGRHDRGPFLTLDPFQGSVGFNGLYQFENTTSGNRSATSTDTLIQESLSLATGGGIVSKNFLDWRAAATVGLNQEWTTGGSQSNFTYGYFDAYDLQATVLRNSDLPVTFFARKGESYVNRAFASVLRNTVSSYGGNANWHSPQLPSSLNFSHTRTVQDDLSGAVQYTLDEKHLDFQTQYEPSDRQQITFEYEYNGVDQNNPLIFNNRYDIHNITASHHWSIDPDSRYVLSEFLNYSTQTGNFPYTQLRLSEQLLMRHTEDFQTNLNYTYDSQQYATSETQTNTFSAGFAHHLFDSLTTTGLAGGSFTNQSSSGLANSSDTSSTSSNVFGDVAVNYTKLLLMGRLNANAGIGFSQTDNGSIGQTPVLNDSETFVNLQPIILTRPGIDTSTIKVYDAAGVLRQANVDYHVLTVGNTVQIQPVAGRFNPNETVKLQYDIMPLPGYTSTTNTLNLGLRYDITEGPLNGLGFFGQYFQQNQDINSVDPTLLVADDIRDLLVGAEYRVWKITLRAEDEHRMSTLAPFDALRFSARYADRLGDRTTVSLAAIQSFLRYPSENDSANITTLDGRLQYEISRDLRSIFSVRWLNTQDTHLGHTLGIEDQAELRWKIRQSDLFVLMRHTLLDTSGSGNNSLFFEFGITRNF